MNEQLETLENQLNDMPANKRIAIYVGLLVLLVYMSWNLFSEEMSTEIETKENSILSLQTKLQKNSIHSFEKSIKNLQRKTLALEEDLVDLRYKKQFIHTKLESIQFIFSNDMGFAKILDNILKKSIDASIDINYINAIEKNVREGKHIYFKELFSINATGSFKSIMNLMQNIDNINAVLNVSSLQVYIDDLNNTAFDLNISHYGVQL